MSKSLPVIEVPRAAQPANTFAQKLSDHGISLHATRVEILQVNVGKLCNQACKHCHVDASPKRTEIMEHKTAERVVAAVKRFQIPVLDITGGAPELNPSFRYLVTEARSRGTHVIVRHNLTVAFEPGQQDLPEFFKANEVEVVSSLPYFLEEQTDAQRGRGAFEKSIESLRRLNRVGYGMTGSDLILNLVYNPVGAFLPPSQTAIESDFKRELLVRYSIYFNRLFTITNMPINRFLEFLRRTGNEERYMRKLVDAFNPATIDGLMCRNLVSVDWQGRLYDCDFNQMLDMQVSAELPQTIADFDPVRFAHRPITTGVHCFGCTAGTGSSCGGSLAAGLTLT